MRLNLLVCLLLLILDPAKVVNADNSIQTAVGPAFPSELAAIKAAADIYNPVSIREDREFIGVILQFGKKYYFTVSAGEAGSDTASIRVSKQSWDYVVSFWHTHGRAAHHHAYFSEVDTALVNEQGKPFYLADHTGILKVYQPGGRKLRRNIAASLGLPRRNGFAVGQTVRDTENRVLKVKTISTMAGKSETRLAHGL